MCFYCVTRFACQEIFELTLCSSTVNNLTFNKRQSKEKRRSDKQKKSTEGHAFRIHSYSGHFD